MNSTAGCKAFFTVNFYSSAFAIRAETQPSIASRIIFPKAVRRMILLQLASNIRSGLRYTCFGLSGNLFQQAPHLPRTKIGESRSGTC